MNRPRPAQWTLHLRKGAAIILLATAGCATVPPPDLNNYGPYPDNYEALVDAAVRAHSVPGSDRVRTVTSVTAPARQAGSDLVGWAVQARIRESRQNLAGGITIDEREYHFLLRNGKVILSDFPVGQ